MCNMIIGVKSLSIAQHELPPELWRHEFFTSSSHPKDMIHLEPKRLQFPVPSCEFVKPDPVFPEVLRYSVKTGTGLPQTSL